MSRVFLAALVRNVLVAVGTTAATTGYVDGDQLSQLVGGAAALVGLGFSMFNAAKQNHLKLTVQENGLENSVSKASRPHSS